MKQSYPNTSSIATRSNGDGLPKTASIKVVIIEPHSLIEAGLVALIERSDQITVFASFSTPEHALFHGDALYPDVIIMDPASVEGRHFEALPALRAACPGVPLLALTERQDPSFVVQVLRAGMGGYVIKKTAAATLTAALRAVAQGVLYLDAAVAGKVVSLRVAPPPSDEKDLSEREVEVLRLVALGHTTKDIAKLCDISPKTVETYKMRASIKLDLQNRHQLVRYAMQQGWFLT